MCYLADMRGLIAIMLLLAPVAEAQDATQIAYFESGRFDEAVTTHSPAETADQLAFKARALLAKGMCGTGQPPEILLDGAEDYARSALELEAVHVEAKLQLAIALSLKARPLSTNEALDTGYGDQSKELVLSALASDPDNAYGHAFIAVWNIEVVRRGGAIGSRIMGASVKKARKSYARASNLSPHDASIHWQYARALAALNPRKYRKDIDAALALALAAPVDGHVEEVMVSRAQTLQDMLKTRSRRAVIKWATDIL